MAYHTMELTDEPDSINQLSAKDQARFDEKRAKHLHFIRYGPPFSPLLRVPLPGWFTHRWFVEPDQRISFDPTIPPPDVVNRIYSRP